MTMRSSRPLVCECGQTGKMHLSENDSPYSSLWEKYRAEGFEAKEVIITGRNPREDVISTMNPKCPRCGQSGRVGYT